MSNLFDYAEEEAFLDYEDQESSQSVIDRGGKLELEMYPKQWSMIESPANKILFGGAAGGGKSFSMRWGAILYCTEIPGLQCYIFRREREDLMSNHMQGPQGFRAILAAWEQAGLVQIIEDEIRFLFNGSRIFLRHCQLEKHKYKYQGAEIHLLILEELTQFTETIYDYLLTRVRMVGISLPEKYKGMFPRVLCGTNPGNLGHQWVKEKFIDGGQGLIQEEGEFGMLRQYIPSLPTDNPKLLEQDPGYIERLKSQSDPELVKAYLYGDWNIAAGRYFISFTDKNICVPFRIPQSWMKFRVMDWGSADPFCVQWWAVSDGSLLHNEQGEEVFIPHGCLVLYREWYGADKSHKGLRLTAEQIADGIVARETDDEKFLYSIGDSIIFAKHSGDSIAEAIHKQQPRLNFTMANNERILGWQQCHSRFRGKNDGKSPLLLMFNTCVDTIRCVRAMIRDEKKIEDIAEGQEDHAVDPVRYACMSRPIVFEKRMQEELFPTPTFATLMKEADAQHDSINGRRRRF